MVNFLNANTTKDLLVNIYINEQKKNQDLVISQDRDRVDSSREEEKSGKLLFSYF